MKNIPRCIACLTLAPLTLLPALALAQSSSLTIFGTVDARIARGTGTLSNVTRLGSSGTNSSRLGLRGVEDLGGGLWAGFVLEGDLNNDDGQGGASNSNNQPSGTGAAVNGRQGLTFNRRSTLSLAGPWGEVRLGRDYSTTFWNGAYADPFGNVGVGVTQMTTGHRAGSTYARTSNGIGYLLPAGLGGFYGQVQHYLGENPSGTATARDGTGSGVRLGWANPTFDVAIASSRTRYASGDIRSTNVYGAVDLKSVKFTAAYAVDDGAGTAPDGRSSLIGMILPLGAGEVRASYSTSRFAGAGDPATRKLAVGYVHPLSKRTALYATVAQLRNRGGANYALNGAATAPNGRSGGYDLGIRHFF